MVHFAVVGYWMYEDLEIFDFVGYILCKLLYSESSTLWVQVVGRGLERSGQCVKR